VLTIFFTVSAYAASSKYELSQGQITSLSVFNPPLTDELHK
jgi:hypothetical protein